MPQLYPCESCFLGLSENQRVCPNCGTKNPHYDPNAKRSAAAERIREKAGVGAHHPSATAGKCEYCESTVYSDEKVCPGCGAPNPNFVVHATDQEKTATRSAAGSSAKNASTGKCPYCNATVRSDQAFCPNCGSENPHFTEDTARVIITPTTIEELKEYCAERNMPLLRMRFFIGEDYYGPRAYGIFKDGSGKVTVYKNKADGTRAVRYSGTDEKRAVQEIYSKLLEECRARGINPDQSLNQTYAQNGCRPSSYARDSAQHQSGSSRSSSSKAGSILKLIVLIIVIMVVANIFIRGCTYCVTSAVPGYLFSSGDGYENSWDSGGSSSFWDWDYSSDYDSDYGSNSWDSWDSGGSDWDSDW